MAEKKKTIAGKFIQAIAGTADQLLTGGKLSSVISAITGDKSLSPEQKQEALDELQMILLDTQNARNNETARDTSEHSSWLSKNIHEIIALIVIDAWVISWWIPAMAAIADPKDAVMLILGYLYGRTRPQK